MSTSTCGCLDVLRDDCAKLLSEPAALKVVSRRKKAARPPKKLPQLEPALPAIRLPGTPEKLTRAAAAAAGQRSFTTPVPLSTNSKRSLPSRAGHVQPTVLFQDTDTAAQDTTNEFNKSSSHKTRAPASGRTSGAVGGSRRRSGSALETDSPLVSDDTLSLTGLVDSESSDNEVVMLEAASSMDMSGSDADVYGSSCDESDSSAAHRRQAKKFIRAAPQLAAPVMEARRELEMVDSTEGWAAPCSEQQSAQGTEKDMQSDEDAHGSDSDGSEASLGPSLGGALGWAGGSSRLPSLESSDSTLATAGTRAMPDDDVVVRITF